jgi:hypothetical protein
VSVAVIEGEDGLLATANREHELVMQAGTAMVEHAIRAGEALLAARNGMGDGEWGDWLRGAFVASVATAHNYMRLAIHQDAVRGLPSMRAALTQVTGERSPRRLPARDR